MQKGKRKPETKPRRQTSDELLDVLFKENRNIVGTFIKSNTGSFIIPDEDRLGQSIDVKSITDKGQTVMAHAISGLKVVASFTDDFPTSRKVNVTEILGNSEQLGVDVLSIIRAYNLYEEFPASVITEAKRVAKPISEKDLERREDFRKKLVITIDPEDAKDLDDAVSLEIVDGKYELAVHIADVSHYIAEDGELEKEAFKRGTSVYFPDRVLPMLPPRLSNGICSLNPNEDRLTLSVVMTIDKNGEVLKHRMCESVININTRFAYSTVQEILDGNETLTTEPIIKMLKGMAELTQIIEKTRQQRGEVTFDIPEPKIIIDETTGKIADVIAYPHLLSHRIIETFMILCNEVVAQNVSKLDIPFVYRVHEKPDPLKVERLVEMLKPFAILNHSLSAQNPSGHAYQKLIDGLDETIKPIVSKLALRSMQKAKYDPNCLGHFGLGAKYYCHFTSPIRRYPDLVIHRIIKLMITRRLSTHVAEELKETVALAAEQSSKTELIASEAEREVDNLKRAEYMKDQIGEQFTGTISGIMDFGVFVYLPNTVEGLIKIENMPQDNYQFHEKQSTLVGRKRTFKMGDQINVICVGVNMARRHVEFAAAK